jgi:hypothetical protein
MHQGMLALAIILPAVICAPLTPAQMQARMGLGINL